MKTTRLATIARVTVKTWNKDGSLLSEFVTDVEHGGWMTLTDICLIGFRMATGTDATRDDMWAAEDNDTITTHLRWINA